MIDFSTVKAVTISEGSVAKITANGVVLWQKETDSSILPDGYTQIEYIQATGTQYIDTGYDPVAATAIEIGYEFTSVPTGAYYYVFGNYRSSSYNCTRVATSATYNDTVINMYAKPDTGSNNKNITGVKTAGTRFDDVVTRATYTTNGTSYSMPSSPTTGSTNSRNLALFAQYVGGRKSYMKLYYCIIREDDTIIRNYIPCLDADGTPCLYDTVSETAYYNAGTGDFEYAI